VLPSLVEKVAMLAKNEVNAGRINIDDEQPACRPRWHADRGVWKASPPAANLALISCSVLESVPSERLFVIAAREDGKSIVSRQSESAMGWRIHQRRAA
jgi:hypothetical protein